MCGSYLWDALLASVTALQVVVSPDVFSGLQDVVQTSGLGALSPNSVMCAWPRLWRDDPLKADRYVNLLKTVKNSNLSLFVVKGKVARSSARAQAPSPECRSASSSLGAAPRAILRRRGFPDD